MEAALSLGPGEQGEEESRRGLREWRRCRSLRASGRHVCKTPEIRGISRVLERQDLRRHFSAGICVCDPSGWEGTWSLPANCFRLWMSAFRSQDGEGHSLGGFGKVCSPCSQAWSSHGQQQALSDSVNDLNFHLKRSWLQHGPNSGTA